MPTRNRTFAAHSRTSGRFVRSICAVCRTPAVGARRRTASRDVAKHTTYSTSPMAAKMRVVMVSEPCRSPECSICGATATAMSRIVRLAAITREVDSFARAFGSWVIAADREPYGMLTKLYASEKRA
jgi:hypothetical protein